MTIQDAQAKYIVVTVYDQYEHGYSLFMTKEAAQEYANESQYPHYVGALVDENSARKRFSLFAGDTYYPKGGWEDYRGDFDTELFAMANAFGHYDWYQIVDNETGKIIATNR